MLRRDPLGNGPVPLGLEAVHAGVRMLHAAGIHSAPAVLIFDAGGRLIYHGPYSNSAWCGNSAASRGAGMLLRVVT
jgi:hypothetical protein